MRSTLEILVDIEDGKRPEYEEIYMACLVLKSLQFFARNNIARLLKGGTHAAITRRLFPKDHADLGISVDEYKAIRMDPYRYLGPDHIPGTPEWKENQKWQRGLLKRALQNVQKKEKE